MEKDEINLNKERKEEFKYFLEERLKEELITNNWFWRIFIKIGFFDNNNAEKAIKFLRNNFHNWKYEEIESCFYELFSLLEETRNDIKNLWIISSKSDINLMTKERERKYPQLKEKGEVINSRINTFLNSNKDDNDLRYFVKNLALFIESASEKDQNTFEKNKKLKNKLFPNISWNRK